jgi:hypothetical protein
LKYIYIDNVGNVSYRKGKTWWWYVLPKIVGFELCLHIAEQGCDVLFLGDPRPLDRLLVFFEFNSLFSCVRVAACELTGGPRALDLAEHRHKLPGW